MATLVSVSRRRILRGGAALLGGLSIPAILRPREVGAAPAAAIPSPDFSLPRTYVAGARPYRKGGFRLEPEEVTISDVKKYVVHNYGHSGAGITLSWGCADAVAGHIKTILDALQAAN